MRHFSDVVATEVSSWLDTDFKALLGTWSFYTNDVAM